MKRGISIAKGLGRGLDNGQMSFLSKADIDGGAVASDSLQVVFYHIPKTAGTSFKESLFNAYGLEKCFVATRAIGLDNFKKGNAALVDKQFRVLSGHFQAYPSHQQAYPNAKRVVWLREPMARAFSSMNHWLKDTSSSQYKRVKQTFPGCDSQDRLELFEALLKNQNTVSLFKTYQRFLSNVDSDFFHFVGRLENIDEDLKRASQLLGVELQQEHLNLGKTRPQKDLSQFEQYLPEEVKQYQRFIKS